MQKKVLKRPAQVAFKNESVEESDLQSLSDEDSESSELEHKTTLGKKRARLSKAKENIKKLKSAKFTKQPTTDELNRLRETENLFNSNFFRLQIEEVLKEVQVKAKYVASFEKWLNNFNEFLADLKDGSNYKISEQDWLSDMGVKMPMLQEPLETKGVFKFIKCGPATIIGSHLFGCALGPDLTVDLKIEMPKETFNKNDYVNERYHRKRALYLCYIAAKLSKSKLTDDLKYKLLNGSNLKPVLFMKPAGKIGKHVNVNLHVTLEECGLKMLRFTPSKNNVREDWRFGTANPEDNNLSAATPFYNTSVLQDLACDINNKLLQNYISQCENIKNGILLLKVWLKQRQITGFSGFIMTMFVAHLMQIRRINNAMSSYQVIRNVWTALATSEWDKNGITLYNAEPTAHHPAIAEFHTHFPVVFVDKSGFSNLCAYIGLDIYKTVRNESQLAVNFLDNQNINGFLPLFMVPVDYHLKYDHILRIEYSDKLECQVLSKTAKDVKLDCGGDKYMIVQKHITDILHKGLGERVSSITLKGLPDDELVWSIDEDAETKNPLQKPLVFGIRLNSDRAFDFIDKGPQANLPEAERFRAFWGTKSELRRFQDGSISEACVWETDHTMVSKRLIVKQIIEYLLEIKLGVAKDMFYVANQFEFILINKKFQPADFQYGSGEEPALKISASFDGLMKNLRTLTDMPLEVNHIHGISPVFSFSDPIPPLPYVPTNTQGFTCVEKYRLMRDEVKEYSSKPNERKQLHCPMYLQTLKVVIQLSHSGKWPDEMEALRRIKAAFNIQLAEALSQQCQLTVHPWPDFIHVFKDGYVYRLEIAHRKEINLLKEVVESDNVTKYKDTDESLEAEYRLLHLPRLRIALNGLHFQHSSFGAAACILKRWLRSHLIDSAHFPDICIDMVMASVFMRPEPFEVPNQPQTAFWRALTLLANSDWNTQMILLNFNDDLTKEEIVAVETNFTMSRLELPALFFVTPYEGQKPSVWSRYAPTYQILARVQILAAESLKLINEIIFEKLCNDVKNLFTPNMDGFDVLIHLKPDFNPLNYLQKLTNLKKNNTKQEPYKKTDNEFFPIVDFDPVQVYLEQLRSSYNEFALFFHNTYGGDVIAMLWKPPALEFREFKTSTVNGRKTIEKDGKLGLIADIDAILEGCFTLGEGVVKEIENKTNVTL